MAIPQTAKKKRTDEVVLRVDGVHLSYQGRPVLRGVSFEVTRGETIVVMGGSGSGKSTLLRVIVGALAPHRGSVRLLGEDVHGAPPAALAALRRRFGILFQSGALYNSMTVGENIALPLEEHTELDEEIIRIIVKMKLELVGLRDFEGLMPGQLSGGMKKRVGLARALALDPEVLFYDEPTAGLDPVVTGVIDKLTMDLSRRLGVTSIVVTHDMGSAFRIADRMIMLYDGRVAASGTPDEIERSEDPVVRQFIHGEPDGPIPLRRSRVDYEEDLLA